MAMHHHTKEERKNIMSRKAPKRGKKQRASKQRDRDNHEMAMSGVKHYG